MNVLKIGAAAPLFELSFVWMGVLISAQNSPWPQIWANYRPLISEDLISSSQKIMDIVFIFIWTINRIHGFRVSPPFPWNILGRLTVKWAHGTIVLGNSSELAGDPKGENGCDSNVVMSRRGGSIRRFERCLAQGRIFRQGNHSSHLRSLLTLWKKW